MTLMSRWKVAVVAVLTAGIAAGAALAGPDPSTPPPRGGASVLVYDNFQKDGGYTLADYFQKWNNLYGPGEMAVNDTRNFDGGRFNVSAAPFRTGYDFGVYDHLKYMGVSNETFGVPDRGSLMFSSDVTAQTPGTIPGLVIHGVYGPPGTWTDPYMPPPPGFAPYQATVLQGQQAAVVMNMIDFCTGQLFDWFVTSDTAFTLIERLPTAVTANTTNPNCPGATEVGIDKIYTQIIREVPVQPGVAHNIAIRYTNAKQGSYVEYFLDGKRVSRVDHVGIPLDKQGVDFTGTYPSLGPGEDLSGKIKSFAIGHGLFSLIDAFPFQDTEAPAQSVSIPVGDSTPADAGNARLFGQGAIGSFDNFTVTTNAHP